MPEPPEVLKVTAVPGVPVEGLEMVSVAWDWVAEDTLTVAASACGENKKKRKAK